MLNKKQVHQGRRDFASIESRHIHIFMRKKIGKEAIDHIYSKVGESVTGVSNESIFGFNEAYDWQISNEPVAIGLYHIPDGSEMVSDVTIVNPDINIFCSIPTGINIKSINQKNHDEYIAEPIFCKCPFDQNQFISLKMCLSPMDLKLKSPKYYWRMLDYIDNVNSATAHFFVYHPLFPDGRQTHKIEFSKALVWQDLDFLRNRKHKINEIFHQTINEFTKE